MEQISWQPTYQSLMAFDDDLSYLSFCGHCSQHAPFSNKRIQDIFMPTLPLLEVNSTSWKRSLLFFYNIYRTFLECSLDTKCAWKCPRKSSQRILHLGCVTPLCLCTVIASYVFFIIRVNFDAMLPSNISRACFLATTNHF